MLIEILLGSSAALYFVNKTKNKRLPYPMPVNASINQEIRVTHNSQTSAQEESDALNQEITLAVVAFGLTTVGALINPLSILIAIPIFVKLIIPFWQDRHYQLYDERKVLSTVYDVSMFGGLFVFGYYWIVALMFGWLSLSKKLILQSRNRSGQALTNAFGARTQKVWVITSTGQEVEIPFEDLKVYDLVVVQAGEYIPADGIITAGIGTIDLRMLTGESQPVESSLGDQVFASSLLVSGRICLRVQESGSKTTAANIFRILENTTDYQSSQELWSQKIADKVILPQLLTSLAALPILGVQGSLGVIMAAIAWDMRLFGPISLLNYLDIASRSNILIKDGRAMEALFEIDTVVFDKTGTLTLEQPQVGMIYTRNGVDENQMLAYAASAEMRQTHPIARAIVQEAQTRQLDLSIGQHAHYQEGFGIHVQFSDIVPGSSGGIVPGSLGGRQIHVGSARYMELEGIDIPQEWREIQTEGHREGYSYVYVALDRNVAGLIELHPAIRPEVIQLVQDLKNRGLKLYILSGDHQQVTAALAEKLGIDDYFAEVLPQAKAQVIERLQADGASVCFVGDGMNDAIALKKAHVSVSMRGASTIAADAASILMLDGNLAEFVHLFELADGLRSNLRGDLFFAVVPGVICIGSVLFLQVGVGMASLMSLAGFGIGIANCMWPLLAAGKENKQMTA